MKAVILAGGRGTRLSEETGIKPKPMIEIGYKPIIWHIMKIYSRYGINDFIICCGYKGYVIKEYFANYSLHMSDVTFDLENNSMKVHNKRAEPWKITLVDTGENTMTGGRLKRILPYVIDEKAFCFTYGDGVCDVNINKLIEYHNNCNVMATVTSVYPPGRFGTLEIEGGMVREFHEKLKGDGSMISGGFFVLSPKVINFIDNDNTDWEQEPMKVLAKNKQISAFEHEGFWQPMDTLRDKLYLEKLWESGEAPWKVW